MVVTKRRIDNAFSQQPLLRSSLSSELYILGFSFVIRNSSGSLLQSFPELSDMTLCVDTSSRWFAAGRTNHRSSAFGAAKLGDAPVVAQLDAEALDSSKRPIGIVPPLHNYI